MKFFRFNAGLAAILVAIALAFRIAALDGAPAESHLAALAVTALYVVEAALVLYWATVGRALARIRPAIVAVVDRRRARRRRRCRRSTCRPAAARRCSC